MSFAGIASNQPRPDVKDMVGNILNRGDYVAVFPKGKHGHPFIGRFLGYTKTGSSIRVFSCRYGRNLTTTYSDASYIVKIDPATTPPNTIFKKLQDNFPEEDNP